MHPKTVKLNTTVDGQNSTAFLVPSGCVGGVLSVPALNAAGKVSLQIYMGEPGQPPLSRTASPSDPRLAPTASANWYDLSNLVLFAENTNGDTAVTIEAFGWLRDAWLRLYVSTDQTPGEGSGDPEALDFRFFASAN